MNTVKQRYFQCEHFKDAEGLLIDYTGDYDGEIKGEALAYQLKTKQKDFTRTFSH